jgi:hypothetical protein
MTVSLTPSGGFSTEGFFMPGFDTLSPIGRTKRWK